MQFQTILKKLMSRFGLSNYALAKKLSASESSIANWLNGSSTPKMEYIIKMAEIFDVSTDYLLLGVKTTLSEEEKQLVSLIAQLTDEEVKELSSFVDYIISKRNK